jgi:hypothetical protein
MAMTAGPAAANDVYGQVTVNGVVKAKGTYDDLTDTLCITVVNSAAGAWAQVRIEPPDGSPVHVKDAYMGEGRKCTGNLSIPEDKWWLFQVYWKAPGSTVVHHSPVKGFYT